MTRHAKFNKPIITWSWCSVTFLELPANLTSCRNRPTFSSGKRNTIAMVSISMPKNVRHVTGPTVFSRASGTPAFPIRS
ncbi:hypothetical protein GDO78_020993 [Eleutherodactylus coqui]|uniref:Uncharacterized protein n=1 Tax=Eleutherodactylus coqui TaxID=57060 RepID=A0A8J6BNM7_ELECQ|nr:hypothetical protein GDO78_020993 [Eleutherodactylus coqui]